MIECIAYEELKPGDVIQEGDEWQNNAGRWHPLVLTPGASTQVRDSLRARRPYKISTLLEIGDALANAQKAATQLQDERDEARKALTQMLVQLTNQTEVLTEVLTEVRADEKRLFDDLELLRSEYIKLQAERDKTRAEAAQLRAERQEWIDRCNDESARALRLSEQLSAAEVAVKSAQRARDELQRQVDELRADRRDEVTARQVQEVLRRWATELDWSADCFGTAAREQIHGIQNTLIAVMQRIESMIDAEGSRAND